MVLQYHQSASKSRFRFIRREMFWYKQQGTVAARVLTQYCYCTEFVPVLAPSSRPLFIGLRRLETCSHWRWKKKKKNVQYFLLVLWFALHLCKSALTLLRLGSTLTQSAPAHPGEKQQTSGVEPPIDNMSATAQVWVKSTMHHKRLATSVPDCYHTCNTERSGSIRIPAGLKKQVALKGSCVLRMCVFLPPSQ